MSGARFRALTLVDTFARECTIIAVDSSFTGKKVAAVLDGLAATRGYPKTIAVDSGSEFYSREMDAWAPARGEARLHPARQTGRERPHREFQCRPRDELLDAELFLDMLHARQKLEARRWDYNGNRPHSALSDIFAAKHRPSGEENLQLG
jgi:putative transposase